MSQIKARVGRLTLVDINSVKGGVGEFSNWNGVTFPLIKYQGKYRLVKTMSEQAVKRELFVNTLCRKFCNTPEVQRVNSILLRKLHNQGLVHDANEHNTLLIRAAQTINEEELPNKNLDSATAAELVFSLWVRRRDVDIWNRSYTEQGLPVFYDLNASLDFEDDLFDIDTFFDYNRYGYAGSWRAGVFDKKKALSALELRNAKDHTNYIDTKKGFLKCVTRMKKVIKKIDLDKEDLYQEAGYSTQETDRIKAYLKSTQSTIDSDVERMVGILFSRRKPNTERR